MMPGDLCGIGKPLTSQLSYRSTWALSAACHGIWRGAVVYGLYRVNYVKPAWLAEQAQKKALAGESDSVSAPVATTNNGNGSAKLQ
jgi:hypothetical protein